VDPGPPVAGRRALGAGLWTGATVVGLAVGGFVFHFPGSFGEPTLQPSAAIFGAVIGAVTGLAVGVVQLVALGARSRRGRLVAWMALGIGITHALNDAMPRSIGIVGVSALAGLGIGASYAAIVGDHRPQPVLLVGAAWAFGLVAATTASSTLGLPWTETPVGWSTHRAIEGIVVGLVWAPVAVIAGVLGRLRADGQIMLART
jgi:hypothetical protein